ncbi:unnamed protein product [Protopolystoma xenopodis]|uniref:Uncharacterized protein n=1 Tax=Protopolystoma xenopodis TaxID=117903 RepID=A0A3S5AR59_9PLAT|nr:unnamed protein product [Protopolystoma xenopodis]
MLDEAPATVGSALNDFTSMASDTFYCLKVSFTISSQSLFLFPFAHRLSCASHSHEGPFRLSLRPLNLAGLYLALELVSVLIGAALFSQLD